MAAAVSEITGAEQPLRYLRERAGVLLLMAGVGSALLIVPLLLTMQFAALSNRPSEVLGDALRGSLYPANFATLAIADIFGTHAGYWGPGASTLAEADLTDDSQNYLFVLDNGPTPTSALPAFAFTPRSTDPAITLRLPWRNLLPSGCQG